MFEVEAKIPLAKKEVEHIRQRLKEKKAHARGTILKKDTYYGTPETAEIRLREEGGGTILCIKKRGAKAGIETNREMEWMVQKSNIWKTHFKTIGWPAAIKKMKRCERFDWGKACVELAFVRGLGWYLEIEMLSASEKEIKEIKKELIRRFRTLKMDPKRFEKKPYLQLLKEKHVA